MIARLLGESRYLALRCVMSEERNGVFHPRIRVPGSHIKLLAPVLICEVGRKLAIVDEIEVVVPIGRVTTWLSHLPV